MELTLEITPEVLSTGAKVYVANFREIDLCTQGYSIEEAKQNAIEALDLLMSTASTTELSRRLPLPSKASDEIYTSKVNIPFGKVENLIWT